jgi:hypothetical protein
MPETAGLGERIDRIDVDSVERSNAAAVGETRHPTPSRVTVAFEYCIRSRCRDRNPARRLLALRRRRPRLKRSVPPSADRPEPQCWPRRSAPTSPIDPTSAMPPSSSAARRRCTPRVADTAFSSATRNTANATASNPSLKENGHLVPELLQSRRGRNCRRVVASVRMGPASPNTALPAFAELAYLRVGRASHYHEFRQRKR